MKVRRWAGAAVVGAVVVASGVAAAAPAAHAAKGPPAARHTRQLKGELDAISCASRSLCVGIGAAAHRGYLVATIRADGTKEHESLNSKNGAASVSCPSASGCALLETRAPSFNNVVVPIGKSGKPGKPMGLGAAATGQLQQIACFPRNTHCVMAGGPDGGSTVDIVTLDGNQATSATLTLPGTNVFSEINAMSCPAATQCYAAGDVSLNGKQRGLIISIKNGQPIGQALVTSASDLGIIGISCPTVSLCEAIGVGNTHEWVYTVQNGKVTHSAKTPKGFGLFGIACENVHLCVAAGDKQEKVGNPKGALVPVRNGSLGKPQVSSVTVEYDGGGGDGTAVIAGFNGGVAAVGDDLSNDSDTILSIS
jgi:hypothetical protein